VILQAVERIKQIRSPTSREQVPAMIRPAILVFLLCLASSAAVAPRPSFAATLDERVLARLDALEKENAALRARISRIEAAKALKTEPNSALATTRRPRNADALTAEPNATAARGVVQTVDVSLANPRPHFEISGSLLYLQPGAGNLEYGTLITPLPLATPNWANQSLNPNFSPAFGVGVRYMPSASNDIELNWTHLDSTASAAFSASPTQMVGPPYLIGPESALYKNGSGAVQSKYDAVNLDGGHTFCAVCPFQLRVFGGVEYARIGQNLSGLFQSSDGTASNGYATTSLFNGAGPRLGLKGQYELGDFKLIGELAAAGLIGTSQSRINFSTNSPAVGPNNQALTSPSATQVIPSIDARLAASYTFPLSSYGPVTIELGYKTAVYFNSVSQYSLTNVPTSLTLPPVGIYLATEQHLQSNFTDQGPYMTGSWAF
jgi:hypothetical protein